MQLLVGLVSGLIFGLGLSVSGMLNPVKVSAFLDIAGAWDPSLAMVMGGGLAVNLFAMWLLKKRTKPYFADEFSLPQSVTIDRPLLIGAALFGVGWALGACALDQPSPVSLICQAIHLCFSSPCWLAYISPD